MYVGTSNVEAANGGSAILLENLPEKPPYRYFAGLRGYASGTPSTDAEIFVQIHSGVTLPETNMETPKGPNKDYSPSKKGLDGFPC